ncbi:MAG: zinc metalloprotease HtpX [Candidatus Nealsonbacteria bacterium RIFCSPLOWO2_01_FULL_43_32]|uniref:Protease HtpX homolog n=1 Tax=Candidatus Nealsonbacteria bacterium RIFCSPLOWO2_01_FULL_43_32 TaxID=1801672 RepID=A0A1G2EE82_9BACT|nr:MAG: zinc metalloprotease HtpX [Candidatus Nealsonbacteria bacterium RIFCSPLOWO2_01_FULL_43_32]
MTLYTQAESNIRKTWLFITLFLIFIIGLGWVFSRVFQNPVILIYAVIFSLLMNLASFWYSDKIVLVLAKAKPIEKQDNPELYRIVENLCITAGLPLPKIYILNEAQPNAFATGRNKNHAVLAVTRGLLEKLDKTELQGVISHELSHIGNKDMLLMAMVVVLVGFISIISDWFLRSMWFGGFKRRESRDEGQAGSILALVGIALAILSPIVAILIQLAISRKREFLADASGALLTRYPEGLASALEKIAADKNPLTVASNATAHLYIANPFRGSKISSLFMTHPPLEERIKALRGMQF